MPDTGSWTTEDRQGECSQKFWRIVLRENTFPMCSHHPFSRCWLSSNEHKMLGRDPVMVDNPGSLASWSL